MRDALSSDRDKRPVCGLGHALSSLAALKKYIEQLPPMRASGFNPGALQDCMRQYWAYYWESDTELRNE